MLEENKNSILRKISIQKRLRAFTKSVIYDFEDFMTENKILYREAQRITIHFTNSKNCYTNGTRIIIGLNSELFEGSDNPDIIFSKAKGVILHEISHIFYTTFKVFSSFSIKASKKHPGYGPIAKDIFNILEDYRIENTFSKHYPYAKKNFLMVRYHIIMNLIEKLKNKEIHDDSDRIYFILNGLLIMGFTDSIFPVKDHKTAITMQRAYFLIKRATEAANTEEIAFLSGKVIELLQQFEVTEEAKVELTLTLPLPFKSPKNAKGLISLDGNNLIGNSGRGLPQDFDSETTITEQLKNAEDAFNDQLKKIEDSYEDEVNELNESRLSLTNAEKILEKQGASFQKSIDKENDDVLDKTKKLPNVHKNQTLIFRKTLNSFSLEDYNEIADKLKENIQTTTRVLSRLKEQKVKKFSTRKKRGKIDPRQVARFVVADALDIRKQPKQNKDLFDLNILVLVDCSGSNSMKVNGLPRYLYNQMMAVYIHEVFKNLNMEHSFWGFDSAKNNHISNMIPFKSSLKDGIGVNLGDIGARSANRDGMFIRLAGETLAEKYKRSKKLLIVISDGLPNHDNYTGKSAMLDVAQAQEEIKEIGVKTVGIFTGNEGENDYFEDMYDNNYILNGDTIGEFPETLHKLLKEEYKL